MPASTPKAASHPPSGTRTSAAPPSNRPAFTLVELLVVIGIIALLIGILLPALNKARQQANSAACLSNLHSLGLSIISYAGTYKGSLPIGGNTVEPNGVQNWF